MARHLDETLPVTRSSWESPDRLDRHSLSVRQPLAQLAAAIISKRTAFSDRSILIEKKNEADCRHGESLAFHPHGKSNRHVRADHIAGTPA